MTNRSLWTFSGAFGAFVVFCLMAGATNFKGSMIVQDGDSAPTCATATADGDLCVEDAIEANGALDVGGAATFASTVAVTGATTLSGAVTMSGASLPSPAYSITASGAPGMMMIQKDGTVVDLTANVLNELHYSTWQLSFGAVVQGGAGTPDAAPTGAVGSPPDGLNIGGTTAVLTDADNWEIWGGTLGAAGRPLVVGTDPAFQFCVTMYVEDVSGSDATYCGFREASAAPVAAGSYADFGAVGHISGQYGTLDEGGATDSGSDAIADTETDIWCTMVSGAGVVTYTVDGVAPTTPGAQTLTDGLLVVPFCNLLHDANLAEDTVISNWTVSYQ